MEKLNLEATKIFCSIIKKLGDKSNLNVQVPGLVDLTIEKHDGQIDTGWAKGTLYTLSHLTKKNKTIVSAPEMAFIVVDPRTDEKDDYLVGIYPQLYRQDEHELYEESVTIENGKVKSHIKKWQLSHCRVANKWMRDIRSQGYLK